LARHLQPRIDPRHRLTHIPFRLGSGDAHLRSPSAWFQAAPAPASAWPAAL
jgi:hypothetical protein